MFGSICPCVVEGFAWLDKREIFVLSDSACIYERAGHCFLARARSRAVSTASLDKGGEVEKRVLDSSHGSWLKGRIEEL